MTSSMGATVEQRPQLPQDLLSQLEVLEELVGLITSADPHEASGSLAAEASQRLSAASERLAAQRLGWIGRIDSDGLWALETMRTLPHWLAWKEGLSLPVARRQVTAARALRDTLPESGRAARAGEVTTEHIGILVGVAATSEARCEALQMRYEVDDTGRVEDDQSGADTDAPDSTDSPKMITGERLLLNLAEEHPLRAFTRIARRFAHVSDPESDERGYRRAQEREHFDVSRTLGGFHLAGFLTEEHGQLLKTALTAAIGTPVKDDGLSPTQRRATALAGLAQTVLNNGLVGTGSAVRPHLSVLIPWQDFHALAEHCEAQAGGEAAQSPADVSDPKVLGEATAGSTSGTPSSIRNPHPRFTDMTDLQQLYSLLTSPGPTWEDGTGPVPEPVLRRIASDCQLTRIVFGPDSEILNVGRTQRTFTGVKRRAIIARDKHCVWPNCDAPPQFGEIHHAHRHWADGGETSTNNAALLCWFHHQYVDTRKIAMHWDRGWRFHAPDSYGPMGSYLLQRNGPDDLHGGGSDGRHGNKTVGHCPRGDSTDDSDLDDHGVDGAGSGSARVA